MYITIDNKSIEIKKANTFFKRLFGLMGKKNINYGLLFKNINSIHTFFMKENIDILILDNDNNVILKYENFPKNKILNIKRKLKETQILELPYNSTINIKINDKLSFINK